MTGARTGIRSPLVLAAAFTALAGLVAAGAFTRLDQWGVDHLMPGLEPRHHGGSIVTSLVPFVHAGTDSVLSNATQAVTLPATPILASVLVLLGCRELWLRREPAAAVGFLGAFVVGNLAEIVGKGLLERPLLFADGIAQRTLGDSFPSGHAFRISLLAALAARLWPGTGRWLAPYVAACACLLVAGGWHTITDVAGGLLLAACLVAAVPRARER